MLLQRFSIPMAALRWRPLFVAALTIVVALSAVKTATKALKPGRTGEQSRTAFLRWRPQVQALATGTDIYRSHNYPNPPIMALILTPLMALPPMLGVVAWFLLKVAMAITMGVLFFRLIETGGTPMPDWAKALAISLSLHPILGDLSHGNVNLLIAFLIAVALDCYRRERNFAAGLVLALAIACKITPALFVPYFVWKRAWKTLAGIAMGLALWWAIVPGAVLGFEFNRTLITSWFEVMVKPFAIDGQITSEHPNQSLPGLLTRLLTDKPSFIDYSESDGQPIAVETDTVVNLGPRAVDWLVKLAMLAFAGVIVWLARTRSRSGLAFAAECSLIVLGMLLFSERTWKHHATTLLLPIAVLIAAALTFSSRRLWLLVLAVPVLSLIPSAVGTAAQDALLVFGVYTGLYALLVAGQIMVLWKVRESSKRSLRN